LGMVYLEGDKDDKDDKDDNDDKDDTLLIGYSVYDKTTKYVKIKVDDFEQMMI